MSTTRIIDFTQANPDDLLSAMLRCNVSGEHVAKARIYIEAFNQNTAWILNDALGLHLECVAATNLEAAVAKGLIEPEVLARFRAVTRERVN